jgi:peptidoglycan/LPS O-acetylase OafA/YrhL
VTYFAMPESRGDIKLMLHTGGDTILLGCLGALLEKKILLNKWTNRIISNNYCVSFLVVFAFIISPILAGQFRGAYTLLFGMGLDNIAVLFFLLWAIHTSSFITNFLNSKILTHIGVLSYSIYIWQQLLLSDKIGGYSTHFPQNIVLVFVVAACSYHLVEKPILKLKAKFKSV